MNCLPHITIIDIGKEYTKIGLCGETQPLMHEKTVDIEPIYNNYLKRLNDPDKLHLIISDLGKEKNEEAAKFFFEKSIAESLLFIDNCVLDIFSYGKNSGVVINYGGNTTVCSVTEGMVEKKKVFDGNVVFDEHLKEKFGYKKSECRDFKQNMFDFNSGDDTAKLAESLFVKTDVIKDIVDNAKNKSTLSSNLFMSGGGSRLNGLESKMKDELKCYRNRIVYEQKFHTFFGASVFGSISQCRQLFIGNTDYREYGIEALTRKGFY